MYLSLSLSLLCPERSLGTLMGIFHEEYTHVALAIGRGFSVRYASQREKRTTFDKLRKIPNL